MRIACAALVALSSCFMSGCSGGGGTNIPHVSVSADPLPLLAGTSGDDWTTFAHDMARTGFQAQTTGISSANVATLTQRWHVSFGEAIKASPLVANGSIYVAGQLGSVRALDIRTGQTQWQQQLGAEVAMTPTLADGMLFVGTHGTPGRFVALDAATGAVRWSASVTGTIRGEPVVVNGIVYEGEAGGDPPACDQGNVRAYDETTGTVIWTCVVDPTPHDGGSVWAPISSDGTALFTGTGNSCSPGVATANALVRLSLSGTMTWEHGEADPSSDDDFGGAATRVGNDAIALNKDGLLYDFDAASGALKWETRLGNFDGYGGVGTPTTDGTTIVAPGGFRSDPTKTAGSPGGTLFGLDRSGNIRWSKQTSTEIPGCFAIGNGLAFGSIDGSLVALDLNSGNALWTIPFGSSAYASPALVPSGLYAVDDEGDVNAYALPAATTTASTTAPAR